MRLNSKARDRRGVTTVETAFVLVIAFMFIFGIIEYARLLWFYNTAIAAAREGARFASVRTGDGTTTAQVQARVNTVMGGAQNQLAGYTVTVYNADPITGNPASGTWTDSPFGGAIGVRVQGTFKFFLPGLMQLAGNSLAVDVKSTINSEAN
jgi:Flp pilus assembly protein TadG